MTLDHARLVQLQKMHPAWRLLRYDPAPLVIAFLHRVFIAPNERTIAQPDLVAALEDELYALREQGVLESQTKTAQEYLNEWVAVERGWLRKFYRHGSDEPWYDLTSETEKAIVWIASLTERSFVGTESRLLTLFDLLKQMTQGSETDPEARLAELQRRREEIDAEIAQVREGRIALLDDTALKDRFQQFLRTSRELLSDFREVEHNFRMLDRGVRERITLWEGAKGELLGRIMGERDAIASSDQGRSFQAFWDFLMSSRRKDEFSAMLGHVLGLPAVEELSPDPRLRRVHYDWLEAGEHTQRMVAELSRQLRRFLDDKGWLESRRIMEILRSIEARAIEMRDRPPGEIMEIDAVGADLALPMERPLHVPAPRVAIAAVALEAGEEDVDALALFSQVVVDKAPLERHIRELLEARSQVTLREVVAARPLAHGLAELVAYIQLADEAFRSACDEMTIDEIAWEGVDAQGQAIERRARLPRLLFLKESSGRSSGGRKTAEGLPAERPEGEAASAPRSVGSAGERKSRRKT